MVGCSRTFGILLTGWSWLDPVISIIIVIIIFVGTWGLLKDSLNLSLDAVPGHINTPEVRTYLLDLPGVLSVHDLHIWAMSTTEVALTAHVAKTDSQDPDGLIRRIEKDLHDLFGIAHVTIQLESRCFVDPEGSLKCHIE